MIVQNVVKDIYDEREIGNFGINGSHRRVYPSNLLDNLSARRLDQHHIEGIDGEMIPPWACAFSRERGDLLAVADESGGLMVLDTSLTGPLAVKQDFLAHKNAVCDIAWMGDNIVTASGDTTVALWDIESETRLRTFRGHTSSVKAVTVCSRDPAVIVTGSMDGHILLWDQRTKRKGDDGSYVNAIRNAHVIPDNKKIKKRKPNPALDSRQSVTAVLFQDEHTLISAGSSDGSIKVWDLRNMSKVNPQASHVFSYGGVNARARGFTSLALDSTGTRVFASCVDHAVYMYDCAGYNKNPVSSYKGHRVSSFYVKLSISPDDQYLLSGSSNHHAYVWQVDMPQDSPLLLKGHSAEVSTVAWSGYTGKLVTASDDCSLMVWRLPELRSRGRTCDGESGEFVGKAEKMSREIGTSVHGSPEKKSSCRSQPVTPRKGTAVPPSPAKSLSTAVKRSIQDMVTSRQTGENKASQSTIVKWLGRSPASVKHKSTPRKLIITPKKKPEEITSLTGSKAVQGVKRRLECCDESSMSRCVQKDTKSPLAKRPRSECENLLPLSVKDCTNTNTARKSLFGTSVTNTPVKDEVESRILTYQSPTLNLPNYVEDPQPRAPQGCQDKAPRTPDWLTSLRLSKKDLMSLETSPVVSKALKQHNPQVTSQCPNKDEVIRDPPKTPVSSKKNSMAVTPTTPKGTPQLNRRGSILKYFSPQSTSKPH